MGMFCEAPHKITVATGMLASRRGSVLAFTEYPWSCLIPFGEMLDLACPPWLTRGSAVMLGESFRIISAGDNLIQILYCSSSLWN